MLVSALIAPGPPAALVDAHLLGQLQIVVSPQLLAEVVDVLTRPRMSKRVSRQEAEDFVGALARELEVVIDPPPVAGLTPDPKDDYLVTLARAAGVFALVSGDRHLTGLASPEPPVLSPRALLDMLDSLT